MMKSTVAAVALLAVSAQAVDFYNPVTALPTDAATTAACANIDLKQVAADSKPFASYLAAKTGQTATDQQLADCATAAKLVKNTDLAVCITTATPPVFNPKGGNALCPLAKGDVCTATQTCKDSQCISDGAAAPKLTCTEVSDVWSAVVNSATVPFVGFPAGSDPAVVVGTAWTTAVNSVVPCSVAGAVTGVTSFVTKKDFKQNTSLLIVSKPCDAKRGDVETAFKAELKKVSDVKDANKLTLDSLKKTTTTAEVAKCKKADGSYGCRGQIKDCNVVLCNAGATCTDNKDCGTKSCKKQVAPANDINTLADTDIKVCSGTSITSAIFAVGAAALAAVALF